MVVHQGLFRRHEEFVAVRRIQLTSKVFIEPGTKIDKEQFRQHQIRSWFFRRRIGVVDSPWALMMLAKWKASTEPKVAKEPEPAKPQVLADDAAPVKQGNVWAISGADWAGTFETKKVATAWLKETRAAAAFDPSKTGTVVPDPAETPE